MQPFLACQVECRYMSTVKILSPVSSYGIYKSIYQVQNGGHGVGGPCIYVFVKVLYETVIIKKTITSLKTVTPFLREIIFDLITTESFYR